MNSADIARDVMLHLEAANHAIKDPRFLDASPATQAIAHSLAGILETLIRTSAPSSIETRQ